MPPLNAKNFQIIADLLVVAGMHKIPYEWSQPGGGDPADHYGMCTPDDYKITMPEPMCYMWAASTNKYHTDAAKEIGAKWKKLVEDALKQTDTAVDMWRMQAKIKDLKIAAVCAIGTPGCLDGGSLGDQYSAWVEAGDDNENAYIKAIKDGVSKCWDSWADGVMVPGMPWYPAYAAFPSASAPPMPNVPTPLIVCVSTGLADMTPMQLKSAMVDALDGGVKDEDKDKVHETVFEAIGTALTLAFLIWLASQQPLLVMGKGPIPTFAPPYVPVGPVIMGDNIASPGHLAA